MKSKKTGLSTLIGIVILVAAIARGKALYICLGIIGAFWIGISLFQKRGEFLKFFREFCDIREAKKTEKLKKKAAIYAEAAEKAKTSPAAEKPETNTVLPERALIRHINYRITDKLRSLYSEAFWEWDEKPTVSFITEGGCRRIRVSNAEEFNFAEVTIDKYSKISLNLLKVVPCSEAVTDKVVSDYPVDVEGWYSTRAKGVLEEVIGELNARGISCLEIDSDGVITALEGKEAVKHGKLENMPAESCWKALCDMLTNKFELDACVDKKLIRVSW